MSLAATTRWARATSSTPRPMGRKILMSATISVASLGGPVLKDKLFFFLNGEVQRFRTTRTANQSVPSAAFKSGVFTYNSPDGSSTPVNLNNPGSNPNNTSGLGFDPTMAKLMAITPNGQADQPDGVSSVLFFPSPDSLNDYTLTGRFDYTITPKEQLTVRYTYGHSADSNPAHSEVIPGIGFYSNIATAHNGAISLTSSLGSNITNLARASYNQADNGFFCQGFQPIDAITGLDSFGHGRDITLPYFGFGSLTYGCGVLGDSNGQARLSSTLLFGDTMTVVKGAHSISSAANSAMSRTRISTTSPRARISLSTTSRISMYLPTTTTEAWIRRTIRRSKTWYGDRQGRSPTRSRTSSLRPQARGSRTT